MRMSRTVTYALQATMQLARSEVAGVPIPCSRLAAEGQMPERFLLQILRNLVTHGILQSTRGVDGGYSLVRRPEEISLLDVIEAVGGPVMPMLPIHDGFPEPSRRRLSHTLDGVADFTRRELRRLTLAHLMHTDGQTQ